MSYAHICPECGWPVDNPACAAGTCQQRQSAVIDPEIQRQIDEARAELRALRDAEPKATHEPVDYLDPVRAAAAEAALEQAEARVDQLTDELALTRDTLTHRTRALNETGTTNDTLRAQLAAIRSLLVHLHTDVVYAGDIRAILDDPGPES